MRRRRFLPALAALAATALLAACGGGGDGDAGIPANTTFNARAAMTNLLVTGGSWTVAGRGNDNQAYTLTMAYAPSTAATFPLTSQTLARTLQSVVLKQGSTTVVDDVGEVFYDNASATPVGVRDSDGKCSAITITGTLPSAGRVGDEGPFYMTTDYASCAVGTVESQSTTRWSIEQNEGRAYLCLTTVDSAATFREIDCVQIDTAGALGARARVRLELPVTGGTFVLDADN